MNQAYEINRAPFVAAKIYPTVESNLEVQGGMETTTNGGQDWHEVSGQPFGWFIPAHRHSNSLQVGPTGQRLQF